MQILPIPALADNYIWRMASNGNAVVIDPGEAKPVLEHLAREQLNLTAILITHRHGDHTAGVAELARNGCPVFGPKVIACVTHPVSDGQQFMVPGLNVEAKVIALPGHVNEHIAYVIGHHWFSGDVMFSAGCGRVYDGDPEALFDSLQVLAALPPDTIIYPTHEYTLSNLAFALHLEPDNQDLKAYQIQVQQLRQAGLPSVPITVGQQLKINPFLRDTPSIRAAVIQRTGHTPENHKALFVALREWKNHF